MSLIVPARSLSTGSKTGLCVRPLLKWAGGKRSLLPQIVPYIPSDFRRYFEPFVGGGALFFNLVPRASFLSDLNADLVNCYRWVRDNPEGVISYLRAWPNSEADYYKVRGASQLIEIERAARTIYLASLSFNGIYRVNLKGEFNVPYGKKIHLDPAAPGPIREASTALQSATIECRDFEVAVADCRDGDLVFFDPPYTVMHDNNGFLKYNDHIFTWADQERLAKVSDRLVRKGCTVLVSNAHHHAVTNLYPGFRHYRLHRTSKIAACGKCRRPVIESLFVGGNN